MGSAQKTDFLSLNKWISTDIPKREDFNYDNVTVDNAFREHSGDMVKHISPAERDQWNAPHFVGFYMGNGVYTDRVIETGCSFDPSFAIVFAGSTTPGVNDFHNEVHKNRFGFATKRAGNVGIALSGRNLVISSPVISAGIAEAVEYNRMGGLYCYILFR
mgnify:FL=1